MTFWSRKADNYAIIAMFYLDMPSLDNMLVNEYHNPVKFFEEHKNDKDHSKRYV